MGNEKGKRDGIRQQQHRQFDARLTCGSSITYRESNLQPLKKPLAQTFKTSQQMYAAHLSPTSRNSPTQATSKSSLLPPPQSHLSAVEERQTKQAKQATISEGNYKHVYTLICIPATPSSQSLPLPPASHTLPHLSIHTRSLLAELRVILSISLADPSGKSKIPRKMLHMPGEKKKYGKEGEKGKYVCEVMAR